MFISLFFPHMLHHLLSVQVLTFPLPLHIFYLSGLPALVVAVSVGFTKAKGYGTVN